MPISLLTEDRFIAQQPITNEEGDDAFLVMAKLDLPGKQAMCFLKIYQPKFSNAIINECAGHIIAESLGFSVPSQAGVIVLPGHLIAGAPSWLTKLDTIAWFSEDTSHPSIKRSVGWSPNAGSARQTRYIKRAQEALLKYPHITQRVIALDDLIANPDRNPGNLLDTEQDFELIDHGRIFGGYGWHHSSLPSTYDVETPNVVANFVGLEGEKLPFKQGVILAYNHLVQELPRALEDLKRQLCIVFDKEEIDAIYSFLVERSRWLNMPSKMGLLI